MVEKAEAFSGRKKNAPIKKPSAMAATAKGNDFSFRRETPLIFVGKTAGYLSLSLRNKELHRAEQRRETFLGEEGKSGVFIHHNPALEKTPWRCTINQTILNVFLPAIIGSRRKNISALKNYLTE
ncbi:hypothetical protein FYJ44_04270 [Desulfovibrio sp. PG-178-WT-4]|uniref:Uncharacterized protein n=1 Tax=Desulfovibrio porci TaxID=2605782 RepID=A0A6L5XJ64_9BACT|nr:hypothetical protein [Desulfovibrio porci]MDY3810991.1 hypothetical protein [Desulfovibrio porci]MSS27275.1 hypothetical protein [Desulfovibrio porci]